MSKCPIKRLFEGLLLMTAILMLNSCIFEDKVDRTIHRTVLVYIGADNNLSNAANSNIYSMNSCISSGMDNYNLLVFVDRNGATPALLHVHNFQIDTVAKFPGADSTDPMLMREVIDEVVNNWKAESYGLVLWSHGTGWLPTNKLHYVASNMGYVQRRAPMTKAFAWEDRKGQNPAYKCMELDELVEAIPEGVFEFIAFDACFMGSVEVLYALRHKTDYIMSSCYEIVSYGFPYHIVTRDFLNGNVIKACNEFHHYYNSMSSWEQMAGISLVETSQLDSLARCFRKVVAENKDKIPEIDISTIQCFDRFNRHAIFDLGDFVDKLNPSKELLAEFMLQLEECVPFKISTPYVFPGDLKDQIKIDKYCGMSVYVPIKWYDEGGLNAAYRGTEWSIDTDY